MENRISQTVDRLAAELDRITTEMYHRPELGNEEHYACGLHVGLLKQHGFAVEEGFCGRETGFRAAYTAQKPGPTVAILVEYDALPGIGHGCGHNIHGAACTGAGIALKEVLEEIGGTVQVIGTPAEETDGAKIQYVEEGVFAGVDFAMMVHASNQWLKSGSSLALMPLEFEFFGKTAHAASSPEMGINALDACVLTMNNINALRQHIRSDSRIHAIIAQGGEAANIVPDYCRMQLYVRSTEQRYNEELVERVINCARAGALATGARLEVGQFEAAMANMRTNSVLSSAFCDVAREVYGIEIETIKSGGSTDMGNVSQVCPAIHPYFDITNQDLSCAGHTRQRADYTITPFALEQMHKAAVILAVTAARVIASPERLSAMEAEFLCQ